MFSKLYLAVFLIFCTFLSYNQANKSSNKLKLSRILKQFSKEDSRVEFQEILDNIVVPRSINSRGHLKVRKFIENYLEGLGPNWLVTRDTFTKKTPVGRVKFTNIVGTYVPSQTMCDVWAGRNASSANRIVLGCHYDSINLSDRSKHVFTGAIDAGVSCAALLYLAKFSTSYLEKASPSMPTLQLVFFDGEEPLSPGKTEFRREDALYGSRHLVKLWSQNSYPQNQWFKPSLANIKSKMTKNMLGTMQRLSEQCARNGRRDDNRNTDSHKDDEDETDNEVMLDDNVELVLRTQKWKRVQGTKKHKGKSEHEATLESLYLLYNTLSSIQLLILLDLIGGNNPKFYNTTDQGRHFMRLCKIERRVMKAIAYYAAKRVDANVNGAHLSMLIESPSPPPSPSSSSSNRTFFQRSPSFMFSFVRDDHLPFLRHDVPLLHLIPHPFPRVWHRLDDNRENLNFQSIQRLLIILQIYLLECFGYKVK